MKKYIKISLGIFFVATLSSCTGYNSLYPSFSNYEGKDSATLYVKDDSYNYAIYPFNLTSEGCFEKQNRRLLTRAFLMKGNGKNVYEYKIKAGQHYIIGEQHVGNPAYFTYQTFTPDFGKTYGVISGAIIEMLKGKKLSDVTVDDLKDISSNSTRINAWNIKNICRDMFGNKQIDLGVGSIKD